MHVLRSVCRNGSQKHMHLACLTPHPKWVICLLPAKTKFTGILLIYPLYWGPEVPCNMLSYLFSCCEAIPTLPVPLFRLLPVYSCVQSVHILESPAEIQSHRFFLAGNFSTIFWKKSWIYVNIILLNFAPKLHSHKKVNFLWLWSMFKFKYMIKIKVLQPF